MIAYMPALLPDETVYSLFCRYYVHMGYTTSTMAQEDILCKRSCNPSTEFIGNIKPKVKELMGDSYDMEYIVRNHTMYPQYARFISQEKKKKALYSLAYEFEDAHHLFNILPRQDGERYLRYCPLCVSEQKEKYGESYWIRIHQLRDIRICVKHRCRLLESDVITKNGSLYTLCPADRYTSIDPVVEATNEEEIAFAEFIRDVFYAEMNCDNTVEVKDILYLALRGTKYLSMNGKMRKLELLARDMKEFYESIHLYNCASYYQIQRVLSGSRYDFNVVCQLGFFLGIDAKRLLTDTLTAEEELLISNSGYERQEIPNDWNSYDKEMLPYIEDLCKQIYEGSYDGTGRPERVSEKAIYRELDIPGQRLNMMPLCKAVFDKYTESYEENWARRIVWAYQKLKIQKNGKSVFWSDIRKMAGVKKEKVDRCIPYIRKYTDDEMWKEISEGPLKDI